MNRGSVFTILTPYRYLLNAATEAWWRVVYLFLKVKNEVSATKN